MFQNIRQRLFGLPPDGEKGIRRMGHRDYIGGMWDEIGQLQFDFLLSRGLKPEHYLLDIACGSLRLGVKAVPYLDEGHYLGIEKERGLLDAGIDKELGRELYETKKPLLIASSSFEFERLPQPDFAIAQSLFTHLTPDLISLCFKKLRARMKPDSVFYATFFEGEGVNPSRAHDHGFFQYPREEMLAFGTRNGFTANYIGGWNHPRNQMMVEYHVQSAT